MTDREIQRLFDRLLFRVSGLEERAGRRPARDVGAKTSVGGTFIGKVKSGSSIPRNGKGTVIRWRALPNGGGEVSDPAIEDEVADFFGVASGVSPIDPGVAVKYSRINGVFVLIDYDCEAVS